MNKSFPAKLLLFGEYSILRGSNALAVPFPKYQGAFQLFTYGNITGYQMQSHQSINKLTEHLAKLPELKFDFEQLSFDLSEGLYFESSIPQGSGLGSSGAVCAAIYDRYCLNKKENPEELILDLAAIESFFHSKSSGIDPLIAYLKKPILIEKNKVILLEEEKIKTSAFYIFLVKLNFKTSTKHYVAQFQSKLEKLEFAKMHQNYIDIVNNCIQNYLNPEPDFFIHLKKLIENQMQMLDFAFPEEIRTLVLKGLESETYYLKLLGSGGGFLLGFTKNPSMIRHLFEYNPHYRLISI